VDTETFAYVCLCDLFRRPGGKLRRIEKEVEQALRTKDNLSFEKTSKKYLTISTTNSKTLTYAAYRG
jgi:hypothetical protein